jgi:hypothetical protein
MSDQNFQLNIGKSIIKTIQIQIYSKNIKLINITENKLLY